MIPSDSPWALSVRRRHAPKGLLKIGENWCGETYNGAAFELPVSWEAEIPREGVCTCTYFVLAWQQVKNSGKNNPGHNYIGHNYIGHNSMGHNSMGHNSMGHNYSGQEAADDTRGQHAVRRLRGAGHDELQSWPI